jgi:hypothetical protein
MMTPVALVRAVLVEMEVAGFVVFHPHDHVSCLPGFCDFKYRA